MTDDVYAVLAEAGFGADLFNPAQHAAFERIDRYAEALAAGLLDRLELTALLTTPRTPGELVAARGFAPAFTPTLGWLLELLVTTGTLTASAGRFALSSNAPGTPADRSPDPDPAYAPAYALLDEAAALYPRVAAGETTGEQALFRKLMLWTSYFSNANRYYALNNRVAARAAADRLGPAASVLELGAGLGSATEALLEALTARGAADRLVTYRVTEPALLFRRRAERALAGRHPALVFDGLDLNQPWAGQGIAERSQTLVWGVNVFHLARNLDAVLREAYDALAPGGWLVVGEGIRPTPDRPVAAELPFRLLESFVAVETDPRRRPTPGFLAAEHWCGAFAAAGFTEIALVPDVIRLRAIHPTLYAAAICGRRPLTPS